MQQQQMANGSAVNWVSASETTIIDDSGPLHRKFVHPIAFSARGFEWKCIEQRSQAQGRIHGAALTRLNCHLPREMIANVLAQRELQLLVSCIEGSDLNSRLLVIQSCAIPLQPANDRASITVLTIPATGKSEPVTNHLLREPQHWHYGFWCQWTVDNVPSLAMPRLLAKQTIGAARACRQRFNFTSSTMGNMRDSCEANIRNVTAI